MIETKNPLFISVELETSDLLPVEEAHHALHVLRLKESDEITITNGKGLVVDAVITKTTKKEVFFQKIKEYHFPPLFPTLHLVVAPTKNIERYEFMIEKCTEIGLSSLTPIICRKSERKELKIERLERIVNAAVKQS
ncbi:MAG TPA: RsmE family RNA methyltransferase, partial [Salinivirgaceae bacterium]|nr:RsmE family RNA methyltransferase [Salinivirgaceae bacterium]